MKNQLVSLIKKSEKLKNIYKPEFFNLKDSTAKERLNKLLLEEKYLIVSDEILGQVEELIKARNPKFNFTKAELTNAAIEYIGTNPQEEFGTWVYYPWSNRLIHFLDEEEFVEVRTNRNHYKITPQEKEILSKKKIGIIGLSVGQSVAVTLAQERSCGELRIADFDCLELSNFNRLRMGLHNLGLNKAIALAREISEIDPYLKVVPLTSGITEENIKGFLLDDGKLDLLIDECDGLHIKVLCRIKAKENGIPVVMEASDRGALDVERFDLDPERPILHGWIDHLDISKLKSLKTNEEKVPYLVPMVGFETMSTRLKASMMEIEQTITTWPQLASAVNLGGAICADVSRRILLDLFHDSGRYFIDIEELVKDKDKTVNQDKPESHLVAPLTEEDLRKISSDLNIKSVAEQIEIPENVIKSLVSEAIKAPSIGNNQPWKWYYIGSTLLLFHDKYRSTSFGDFEDMGSLVAFGAAIENIVLESYSLNINVQIEMLPYKDNKKLVAIFRFFDKGHLENKVDADYYELRNFISKRFTDRRAGNGEIIKPEVLERLKKAAEIFKGVKFDIVQEKEDLKKIGEIVGRCDKIRFMHFDSHQDFFTKEARWTTEEYEKMNDGIDMSGMDLTPTEFLGFKMASDYKVIKLLKDWKLGGGMEKKSRVNISSSSAIGLISIPEFKSESILRGGRSVQRMWLQATKENISVQPILGPIFFISRLIYGDGFGMDEEMKREVGQVRDDLLEIFPGIQNRSGIFLIRLFIADPISIKNIRRSVQEVLYSDKYKFV